MHELRRQTKNMAQTIEFLSSHEDEKLVVSASIHQITQKPKEVITTFSQFGDKTPLIVREVSSFQVNQQAIQKTSIPPPPHPELCLPHAGLARRLSARCSRV